MYGSVEQAFVGRDEPKNGREGGSYKASLHWIASIYLLLPEEDRQVGRNIGVLYKRVLFSFVFCILLHEEHIYTYRMPVKYYI